MQYDIDENMVVDVTDGVDSGGEVWPDDTGLPALWQEFLDQINSIPKPLTVDDLWAKAGLEKPITAISARA